MNRDVDPFRVLVKALCLFLAANLCYALVDPQAGKVSGYNGVFPGRTRLPFGISGDPYTVAVDYVDSMFASHLIAAPKGSKEYRVALIGDSSIWGENLAAYEVISEQWNRLEIECGDRNVRVYDLGYPHPSIVKDLIILDKALEYEPDLIIWFVTLNSLFSQRMNPFLEANRERADAVVESYDISFRQGKRLVEAKASFLDRTLIGRRSSLARSLKLQVFGIVWAATGADTNTLARDDVPDFSIGQDPAYRGLQPPEQIQDLLLLSALAAGNDLASPVPVLLINEPIYIGQEAETGVRYNPVYPRWAYDQYREALTAQAQAAGWMYLDLWNALPSSAFSDAGLHRSREGERLLIYQLNPALQSLACNSRR